MNVLGIDYGAKRIGLAVSDPDGRIALPVGSLESRGRSQDLQAIGELVRERGVEHIVVGLPIHMNGSKGPEAEAAERFARELGESTGLPVSTLDERWTTLEADRALSESGLRGRRKRKAVIDSVAATLLLRTFLERESRA